MEEIQIYAKLRTKLKNSEWRLDHLYWIINKDGLLVPFIMNRFQRYLLSNIWFLNIILKARQLGFSTFIAIYILDQCIFNSNLNCGIIDITRDDATKKLDKIKLAWKYFGYKQEENSDGKLVPVPSGFTEIIQKELSLEKENEQEVGFSNGSTISVGTSYRGGTLNILHVSELAKICKRNPLKAEEIKTGALNAVAKGQMAFIESTAEDGEGYFYDLCDRAEKNYQANRTLTQMDWKFFFFPWWQEESYQLKPPKDWRQSTEILEYFLRVETEISRTLDISQRYWYIKKKEDQGDAMKKEYPATSIEAFEASTEGRYYKKIMLQLHANDQICEFDIEKGYEIDTYWDLGRRDATAIIFVQKIGKEIRIVDFFEGNDEHVSFFINEVKKKDYLYGKHWLPHDSKFQHLSAEKNVYRQVEEAFGHNKVTDVENLSVEVGINEVRKTLKNCWFKRSTTELLVHHLENHSKKWNVSLGRYTTEMEDDHIHACMVGSSLISTIEGDKRIDSIRKGEYIKTPMGFAEVVEAGKVRKVDRLIKITLANGRELRVTLDHKIFTQRGLVRSDALGYTDSIINSTHKVCKRSALYSRAKSIGYREAIIQAEEKVGRIYTEQYGEMLMGIFQRGITSITSMVRDAIIGWKISNVWREQNIYQSMGRQINGLGVRRIWNSYPDAVKWRKSGTQVRRGKSGIASLGSLHGRKGNGLERLVRNVVERIRLLFRREVNIATRIVRLEHLDVEEENPWVYDLTVRKHHCYLANDMLVSNCDAMRYMAVAYKSPSTVSTESGAVVNKIDDEYY